MKLKPYKEYVEYVSNVSLDTFLHFSLDKQIAIVRMLGAMEQMEFVISNRAPWSTILDNWNKKALELFHFVYNQYTKGTINNNIESINKDYQLISQFSYSLLCCTLSCIQLGKIRRLALDLLFLVRNPEEIEGNYSLASLLMDETFNTPDDIDFEELDEYSHMVRIFDEWESQGTEISTTDLVERLSVLETFAYSSNKDFYNSYIEALRGKLNNIIEALSVQKVTAENIQDYTSLFEFSISLFEDKELLDIQDMLYKKLDEYLQDNNESFNESYLAPISLVVEYIVRNRLRNWVCEDERSSSIV